MRPFFRALPITALVLAAGCDSLLATTTTTTTAAAPVTGLRVRASTMLDGLGCGTGDVDPNVWGGVVRAKGSTTVLAARVVDCFADLVFHDLPMTDAAVDTYTIDLVAFTLPAWNAVAPDTRTLLLAGRLAPIDTLSATWRSSCEGVQEQGLRRDAVCAPFSASDAGVPASPDAGTDAGTDEGTDAGTDAGVDDAGSTDSGSIDADAGADASTADAGN